MPASLSDLTLIIFNMELTHLGSKASKNRFRIEDKKFKGLKVYLIYY